jgi:hypothetical protein
MERTVTMKNMITCGAMIASIFLLIACGEAPATLDSVAGENREALTMVGGIGDGQALFAGDTLVSPDGRHVLRMGPGGDLVLRNGIGRAVWSTGTAGHPGAHAILQGDGNFVVYGPAGHALWSSGTFGHRGDILLMQDDGHLVIYGPAGHVLWIAGL